MNQTKTKNSAVASTDPLSIVREYSELQRMEKDLEKRKDALKVKLNMLIPAGEVARAYVVPERPGGRYVARRVRQDRRKPNNERLMALLSAKNAPDSAYIFAPNHEAVAEMIANGSISLEEFGETMEGAQVEYVSLTWQKNDAEKDAEGAG